MAPQIEKPQDEKEAIARLTYAVEQMTNVLVSLHEQLRQLNQGLRKPPGPTQS